MNLTTVTRTAQQFLSNVNEAVANSPNIPIVASGAVLAGVGALGFGVRASMSQATSTNYLASLKPMLKPSKDLAGPVESCPTRTPLDTPRTESALFEIKSTLKSSSSSSFSRSLSLTPFALQRLKIRNAKAGVVQEKQKNAAEIKSQQQQGHAVIAKKAEEYIQHALMLKTHVQSKQESCWKF